MEIEAKFTIPNHDTLMRLQRIVRLGTFVMEGAMAQLAAWQRQYNNPNMFMCINVAAPQVFQPSFFENLQAEY